MAGQLSTEQLLLLNNLMYMNSNDPLRRITDCGEGSTVAEIVNSISLDRFDDNAVYTTGTTGREWKEIIQAIRNDSQLMNVQLVSVHVDNASGGGGGKSALFTDPGTGEAVVVFRGTDSYEWKDNFLGGAATDRPDGVSTVQQENALEWYQSLDLEKYSSVTVTGHSKGGNKAKYITLMEEGCSVDRCVSFDGQGFSDEFYEKYADRIAGRQDLIRNHNVDGDYVNILMNDVGETTYYKAYNIGDLGPGENHCPNTYFKADENGNLHMVPGKQDRTLAMLDDFLNGCMRSMDPKDKKGALNFLGELAEMLLSGQPVDIQMITDLALEGDNIRYAAQILAYLRNYEQAHPEFAGQLEEFLNRYGFEEVAKWIDAADQVLDWKYSDQLFDVLDWASDKVPDWLLKKLSSYLKDKLGIDLSTADLKKFLSLLRTMNGEMDRMQVKDGSDRKVSSASGQPAEFAVRPGVLGEAAREFGAVSGTISGISEQLGEILQSLTADDMKRIAPALKRCRERLQSEADSCRKMEQVLETAEKAYNTAEKRIVNQR